jgi:hypothetical protein
MFILVTIGQLDMRSQAFRVLTLGWIVFGLVMLTVTHEVRCPRCGQRFYAKGRSFGNDERMPPLWTGKVRRSEFRATIRQPWSMSEIAILRQQSQAAARQRFFPLIEQKGRGASELAFFRGLSDGPGGGLAEVLGRRWLLRYLCRTAFRLAFQRISLPLCFIGFCTLRCHTYSFAQRGFFTN